MYGAGLAVFAVWGYVISHARGGWIELNPTKLADTLGGSEAEIHEAISFLSSPDPKSRCKDYEGRRLIKEGEFKYFLPSWEYYHKLRKEEDRREQNRIAQAAFREKHKSKPRKKPAPKEVVYEKMVGRKFDNPQQAAAELREIHGVEEGEFERTEGLEGKTVEGAEKELVVWDEASQSYKDAVVVVPNQKSLRDKIQEQVDNDPLTQADKVQSRRLWAKSGKEQHEHKQDEDATG